MPVSEGPALPEPLLYTVMVRSDGLVLARKAGYEDCVRLAAATRAVREGKSLTDALTAQALTTPVAERMLRVGERSGNMGEMMERIAAFYDNELSRFVDVATRLIEPAMMTVIGLVIGAIVVLMYMPIFDLATSLQ